MRFHVSALLGLAMAAPRLLAQTVGADTMPAAVVQRFVDAANAADVDVMMTRWLQKPSLPSSPAGRRSQAVGTACERSTSACLRGGRASFPFRWNHGSPTGRSSLITSTSRILPGGAKGTLPGYTRWRVA
jgi:hypothetical protein